jgi:8-oxo-dGTP pyrophosphatase MutT (NUDIX family)
MKKIKQNLIYSDQWLKFYQDEVEFPDGKSGTYAWADRKDGVVIGVVGPNRKILLNKEFRYVVNEYSWEVPGGGIDEGESFSQAATRELQEETGLVVEDVEPLSVFYPLSSLNTEKVWVFIARTQDTQLTDKNSEIGEDITQQAWVDFDEALRMIDEGEITDVLTAAVVQMVVRKF